MVNGWYCGRFEEVGDTKVVVDCQGLVMEETGCSQWALVLLTMMMDTVADFKADLNMILQCASTCSRMKDI